MKFLLPLWLLVFTVPCPGQFPVSPDNVYTFIKNNSIHRDKADWLAADRQFTDCIAKAKSANDTMHCFVDLFKILNDIHSNIIFNNQYFGYYHPADSATYSRIGPVLQRANAEANKVYCVWLEKGYAYIRVPAYSTYSPDQVTQYGQALYDSLCRFGKGTKGFVIDLRTNSGGNMYPMLSGLSSLLGNTTVAYEMDIDSTVARKWEIQENNFIIGGVQVTHLKKSCSSDNTLVPVAVLTGPVTGSSGSMVAIAFKKRKNTCFIGEPTADGYTTSNGYFQYASNLFMNLATHFVADREKQVYKKTVDPDLHIQSTDNFENLLLDEKIKAALKWLKKKR